MQRQIVPGIAGEVRTCKPGAFDACIFEAGDARSRKLPFGEFFVIKKYDKGLL
jgi:hypothetical protein